MNYPIVGAYFRPPAKAILQVLKGGTQLWLVPEPHNEFDQFAVKVVVKTTEVPEEEWDTLEILALGYGYNRDDLQKEEEWHLGYVPRTVSQEVSEKLCGAPTEGALTFDPKGNPRVELS